MEIRVLQYFLAIAREQSISRAAESLHLSQPTLSVQIRHLEEELGKQLILRGTPGSKKITLTEEGVLLRKRAEEILQLVKKAEDEITLSDDTVAGNVFIGAAETEGIRQLIRVQSQLKKKYPLIQFHMKSGDKSDILESLDRGLADFGLIMGKADDSKYDFIELNHRDTWGVLMRKDSPLAQKEHIQAEDLWDKPLILSRQEHYTGDLLPWFRKKREELNRVSTYNLLFNGSLMVEEGLGYAICLDKIINTTGDSQLCFRPFYPKVEIEMRVVWKRYQVFSKASEKFLQALRENL